MPVWDHSSLEEIVALVGCSTNLLDEPSTSGLGAICLWQIPRNAVACPLMLRPACLCFLGIGARAPFCGDPGFSHPNPAV